MEKVGTDFVPSFFLALPSSSLLRLVASSFFKQETEGQTKDIFPALSVSLGLSLCMVVRVGSLGVRRVLSSFRELRLLPPRGHQRRDKRVVSRETAHAIYRPVDAWGVCEYT